MIKADVTRENVNIEMEGVADDICVELCVLTVAAAKSISQRLNISTTDLVKRISKTLDRVAKKGVPENIWGEEK